MPSRARLRILGEPSSRHPAPERYLRLSHLLFTVALAALPAGFASAQDAADQRRVTELGIDVFGVSYHYRSSTYFDGVSERHYDEWNPGLGLHIQISETARHIWMLKAGYFNDSQSNRSVYGGPVYQYRVSRAFSAGLGLLLFNSESYASPVIPLPLVSYRVGPLRLNGTWIPAANETGSPALAAFATLTLLRR